MVNAWWVGTSACGRTRKKRSARGIEGGARASRGAVGPTQQHPCREHHPGCEAQHPWDRGRGPQQHPCRKHLPREECLGKQDARRSTPATRSAPQPCGGKGDRHGSRPAGQGCPPPTRRTTRRPVAGRRRNTAHAGRRRRGGGSASTMPGGRRSAVSGGVDILAWIIPQQH